MTIQEKANEVVEEFEMFDNWLDKYDYIIELGKELEGLSDEYKTSKYLISGCQSQVWLTSEYKDGKVYFKADSDAIITKGIVYLLIRVLSGHKPSEILDYDLSFLEKIGLKSHLSPTRSNGLNSMIKQIRLYALVYQTKENQK
ncbi:MAG: SufE family protein [Bacteroidetes bacterium]|nr:MAG: SufE family protein [Bacteroidota bacterium]